jgi:hypothetical protein
MAQINKFINTIPVSLDGCISWPSAPLFVTYVQGELFIFPIMNMFNPTPNCIHAYTFFSINSFHVSVNVDWRHNFCSHKLYHCMLLHYKQNSDHSNGWGLKFNLMVQEV